MKKVTLKDIANELGVTIGTVSHVLNGIEDISPAVKEKVLQTAKRLGYIPNSAAIALRAGKTKTIAVIIPYISNPFLAHQVNLIETELKANNYSLMIFNTNEDEEAEHRAIVLAASKQVDGILICPCQATRDNIEFLQKLQIPFLQIGRYYPDLPCDYVGGDDFKGGYLAGQYLYEHGYRKTLYVGEYTHIIPSKMRFDGLSAAFAEHGIAATPFFFDWEAQINLFKLDDTIRQALKNVKDYDSIVASCDLFAMPIISYLKKEMGESMPPVIGFDSINQHLHIPMHHISVSMSNEDGYSKHAVSALLNKINGSTELYQKILDVSIFEYHM